MERHTLALLLRGGGSGRNENCIVSVGKVQVNRRTGLCVSRDTAPSAA